MAEHFGVTSEHRGTGWLLRNCGSDNEKRSAAILILQAQGVGHMLQPTGLVVLSDQTFSQDLKGAKLANHLLVRAVARERVFCKVDFSHAIFDTCYFRKCRFDSCDFTGCRFVGSNFIGSTFIGSTFNYAIFERTLVTDEILDTECPSWENVQQRFARSLRVNFQQLGDSHAVNKAIGVELRAEEIHLRKAWRSPEAYYRQKYRGWNRIAMFGRWMKFRVLDILWGNGESPLKLLRAVIVFLALIALVDAGNYGDRGQIATYVASLAQAPSLFLGFSGAPPAGAFAVAVAAVRLIVFGLFVSILVKRYNRR